jgi:hypothetical protein
MLLKSNQIIEGVDFSKVAGVDKTHEQIPDFGPMLRFVKKGVLSVQYGFFQSSFADIVYGCFAMHPLKKVIQNTSQ